MLEQTPAQKAALSIEIEQLIAGELKATISHFIRKYEDRLTYKLGIDRDDLMNDIRMQIWKGLISWSPDKKAKRYTYLSSIIEKRFRTLIRQAGTVKFSSISYYADPFTSKAREISEESTTTYESGEELLSRRQEQMQDYCAIDDVEPANAEEEKARARKLAIYQDLLQGAKISEMTKKHGVSRTEVVRLVNEISQRVAERRANTARGPV
jgi:DNA-directed RNA polymerase specialized sigma24 family protein